MTVTLDDRTDYRALTPVRECDRCGWRAATRGARKCYGTPGCEGTMTPPPLCARRGCVTPAETITPAGAPVCGDCLFDYVKER